ncbi:MAG: Ldh family oxidoreductase [Clostridiales bacterium]|nr:Ldh family oxidoreductase [Clostridiales bacterium]
MSDERKYPVEQLSKFSIDVLTKVGLTKENAEIVTDSLLFADLRNVSSHGIVRLPTYTERISKGIMNLQPEMRYSKQRGATGLLDAENGLGQLAGYKAMHKAIDLAKEFGIGMVAVKNSNHFGTASWFSMMALEEGMIGITMANASPAIAPFGTAEPLLGTNPLSIAVPAKTKVPIVLDMAMSTVARGKIRLSALKNEQIPLDWGLDESGNPTSDPNEALKGSLVPIGGVKGSALSLIVDLICGVMTDTGLTGTVKNITDMSGPSDTGHAFIAINIADFIDYDLFINNVDAVVAIIKNLKPRAGQIYMAGEIEHNLTEAKKAEGIPLDAEVVSLLNQCAKEYGADGLPA